MFNVQKTHYFLNTVHYLNSSMPRLSQTSPTFRQAQSALIGQLTQACVGNVTPLSIIASFSFSFTISSSPRGLRDRHSDDARMYLQCD